MPLKSFDPAFGVAGRADQIVLQPHFGFSTVARIFQSMRAHQFAVGSFDGVAAFGLFPERFGLLFHPARLQRVVMLSNQERPVFLFLAQAALAQRAGRAKTISPFKAIGDPATLGQAAALGVLLAGRADGFALGDINGEVFAGKALVSFGRALSASAPRTPSRNKASHRRRPM